MATRMVLRRSVVCALISLVSLSSACNGAAKRDLGVLKQATEPRGDGWTKLLEGETRQAHEAMKASAVPKDRVQAAWRFYGLGESASLLGDYEAAVEAPVEAVVLAPDGPSAAWARRR